jgi:hypothetical protein
VRGRYLVYHAGAAAARLVEGVKMVQPLLLQGDACHLPLADQSVACIVTSPPYYGLRAYENLAPTVWCGGSYVPIPNAPPVVIPGPTPAVMATCAHGWEVTAKMQGNTKPGIHSSLDRHGADGRSPYLDAQPGKVHESATCRICGAWRGVLGGEETPQRYVWNLLQVLRECSRVLRDDGTLWLNLGDAAASGNRVGHGTRVGYKQQTNRGMNGTQDPCRPPQPAGYQDGALLGLPWQVALAAQADGWILREQLTWWKKSAMPESIQGTRWEYARCPCRTPNRTVNGHQHATANGHREDPHGGYTAMPATLPDPACPDCHGTGRLDTLTLRRGSWRHTRATEPVFMLCKSMGYWANSEALREPLVADSLARISRTHHTPGHPWAHRPGNPPIAKDVSKAVTPAGRNPRNFIAPVPTPADHLAALRGWLHAEAPEVLAAYEAAQGNPQDVVSPSTNLLKAAHHATFSAALVAPLITASCPEQCCARCGTGYAPIVTASASPPDRHRRKDHALDVPGNPMFRNGTQNQGLLEHGRAFLKTVHGLRPTCPCPQDLPPVPGLCLDPFSGAGTVGLVARELRRRSVLMEASPTYVRLAQQRLGLTDLRAWEGTGGRSENAVPLVYTDLPLFGGTSP